MSEAEDQRAFEDMVKAREKDSGMSNTSAVDIWFDLLRIGWFSLSLYPAKNSFDAIEEFNNSNSETLQSVYEELWGKPDERITKLPQSD